MYHISLFHLVKLKVEVEIEVEERKKLLFTDDYVINTKKEPTFFQPHRFLLY